MKTVRSFAVVMAMALFVTAVFPFATKPAAASDTMVAASSPVQKFMEAALGQPLLSSMSLSGPVYVVSVESAAAGSDYACSLVSQKPKDWTKMQRRQSFDAVWSVKNTGKKNWGANSVDFGYVSGTKMHSYGAQYDLSSDIGTSKKVTLTVDMVSPKNKGYFTTVWGLYKGSKVFCKLSLTINVNK